MQILRHSLFAPLHYWRTIVLVWCVGLIVSLCGDDVAVLLCTLASSFAFFGYERRRWISVSSHYQLGDVILRLSLAMLVAFFLAHGRAPMN